MFRSNVFLLLNIWFLVESISMKNDNKTNSFSHTIYNQTQNQQHRKIYGHKMYNKDDNKYSEAQVFISIPNLIMNTNFHESFPKKQKEEQIFINQKSENEIDESFLQNNFDQTIDEKMNNFEGQNEENTERTHSRLMNNFVDDGTRQVAKVNKRYPIFTKEELEDVCIICLNNFDDCSHFQVDLLDQKLNEEKNIHRAHNSQWHEECIFQWIKVNSQEKKGIYCPLCQQILKDPRVQENYTTAVHIIPNNDIMFWKNFLLVIFFVVLFFLTLGVLLS